MSVRSDGAETGRITTQLQVSTGLKAPIRESQNCCGHPVHRYLPEISTPLRHNAQMGREGL